MVDWSSTFSLETVPVTVEFNSYVDMNGSVWIPGTSIPLPVFFLLDENACSYGLEERIENYPIPAGDGSIQNLRFVNGMQATMKILLWETNPAGDQPAKVACGEEILFGADWLNRGLNDLLRTPGRLNYNCADGTVRILDEARLTSAPVWRKEDRVYTCEFTLDSPFPYWLTLTQFLSDEWPDTLTNVGTAPMYPVWKVYAGSTDDLYYFTIRNDTYDVEIVYNADLPGAPPIAAGDYVEIDSFRNTVYLNGNQSNLKKGIDIEASDFFPLYVGDNDIIVSGSGTFPEPPLVECLWNYAWW